MCNSRELKIVKIPHVLSRRARAVTIARAHVRAKSRLNPYMLAFILLNGFNKFINNIMFNEILLSKRPRS